MNSWNKRNSWRYIVLLSVLAALLVPQLLWAASAKLHIDVGLNHFYKKRYLEAFQEFKAAVDIDPRNAEAHFNLGRVYRIQGFLKEAATEFGITLTLDPRHAPARRDLAEIKQFIKSDESTRLKIEGQEEALRQRSGTDSTSGTSSQRRGEDYLKKGDINRAISEFEEALKTDAFNPKLHKLLGFLYFRQNRFRDALSAYTQAQKFAPSDAEVPYSIGMVHLRTENPQEALLHLKKSVDLDPGMTKAQFGLGEAYEALGQHEDALFQYRKSLQISPNLAQAQQKLQTLGSKLSFSYFSRGTYYYKQGEHEKAEALLSLAEKYGSLTSDQQGQTREMLTACRYWLGKKRVEQKENFGRKEVRDVSYINKTLRVEDVSANPNAYVGQSIEWTGWAICSDLEASKPRFYVNSSSNADSNSNLDFAFGVQFSKDLPNDARVSEYSQISVKGKIIGVEKIMNTWTNVLSKRRQPIVEASEVTFSRENYEQPLILRFY
jgi:tetratricopeptide (TPR) repeat protein